MQYDKPAKKKDALTDEQAKQLLEATKELPPYVFIMTGLYSGLRREEILALQWDCCSPGCTHSIHFCTESMAYRA